MEIISGKSKEKQKATYWSCAPEVAFCFILIHVFSILPYSAGQSYYQG